MKKISIAIMVLVVVLASCKKTPEVNLKYVDVERDLITVGTTTATVQCDYQYIATLKKAYLYYGEDENEVDMNTAEMRVVQNTLYVDLAGLTANTTYNYYYEFHNGFNSMRTALKTFKTEGGSGPAIILPTVVTGEVTEITTSSAKGSGEVTNDGGAEVTERGICWSTNENPTLSDNHVAAGIGTGDFTALMSGLEANTTYHVRAYATNEVGTAYGLDREFVTSGGGSSGVPEGAINGLFTINDRGDQVYFSQGNLQYQASTNTWRFAENQYSFVGGVDYQTGVDCGNVYENGIKCDNGLMSPSYDGWMDLFGWGTSGFNHGAVCYQPWSTSGWGSDYFAYGSQEYNLDDQSGQADWGYNAIINGGNATQQWRTLTVNESAYVFEKRSTSSGIRFAKAQVNGVNGVLLLPDDWNSNTYDLNSTNIANASYTSNVISASQWVLLETTGAVFLPVGGYRYNTLVESVDTGSYGTYWTATLYNSTHALGWYFSNDGLWSSNWHWAGRCNGQSVRLVQDANLQNKAK